MTPFAEWAAQYPEAAAKLTLVFMPPTPSPAEHAGKSEAWAQQRDRMTVARAGGMAWRNNVGATPARCPDCNAPQRPVRYGLANDSHQLNQKIKSADLICSIPRLITLEMVGTTIAQFGSIESKRPGWTYSGTPREVAQAAWAALLLQQGAFAKFSTGDIEL